MPSKPEVIKARRLADPEYAERIRGYARKYRAANLELERARNLVSVNKKRGESREAYNAYSSEWRTKNKERLNAEMRVRRLNDPEFAAKANLSKKEAHIANPLKRRNMQLKSNYGMTLEDYDKMYDKQNGECAICGVSKKKGGRGGLVIDHCHDKGHVRGLLCSHCNTGLGHFRDDTGLLKKAIDYLTHP